MVYAPHTSRVITEQLESRTHYTGQWPRKLHTTHFKLLEQWYYLATHI